MAKKAFAYRLGLGIIGPCGPMCNALSSTDLRASPKGISIVNLLEKWNLGVTIGAVSHRLIKGL